MRFSVTDVDSWRYYKATDTMESADLIARLLKKEPPTHKMMAGRALHTVLEHAQVGNLDRAEAEGFTFIFEADCEIPVMPVRELKREVILSTPSGPVTLVGMVDGLDGAIRDYKLTERFDAERYADSYQWRCYLTMFGATKFLYDVFEAKENDRGEWVIWGFQRFPLYAYDGMRDDVVREVSELAEFVAVHVPEKAAA